MRSFTFSTVAALGVLSLATLRGSPAQAEPAACLSQDPAQWPAPSRPYFMVVLDSSGSMSTAVAGAAPSCAGYPSTRMGHAKCALSHVLQSYGGQVNFGLAEYAVFMTSCGATCLPNAASTCQGFCFNAEVNTTGICAGCGPRPGNATTRAGANILVPMQQDAFWMTPPTATNVPSILSYLDNNCTSNTEVAELGNTPINGALRDMRRYFATGWSNPDNAAITYPTPLSSNDRPCRSVNVLFITDGDETCDTQADAVNAAASLLTGVTVGGNTFPIRTYVINFAGGNQVSTDQIAAAGGTSASYFATNETQLSQALSTIIASAARPETCDNADNNCNGCTDEGFVHYCNVQPVASNCCAWTTAAQRTTCLTSFQASITAANPSGNTVLLPCTTAAQQALPASWLCFNPGDACDTVDNNCDSGVDEGARRCGTPAHCPQAETCNGQDDDCDGLIDNGGVCMGCVVAPEVCDGCDNDCDGVADNGIAPIPCGLASPANCAGTQTCTPRAVPTRGACIAGAGWSACSNSPAAETCDMVDNNCNGVVDDGLPATTCGGAPGLVYGGASQCRLGTQTCGGTCMGAVGPTMEVCDGVDNDCNGMTDDGLSGLGGPCCRFGAMCGMGVCTAGRLQCSAGVSACVGGTGPAPEICNGLDDDCNGVVDDNVPAGGSCGTGVGACRTGNYQCRAGRYECVGATMGSAEVCDGVDNDCNGVIDDGNPGGGAPCSAAPDGGMLCGAGTMRCRNGALVCEGGRLGATEVCNCMDDNCDGQTDEDPRGTLCPGGGRCLQCECRTPCRGGEFPCSAGLRCDVSTGAPGFCVPDTCGGVVCRADQVCRTDRCVDPCDGVSCATGQTCRSGVCLQNDCYVVGCLAGQRCQNRACVADPCASVTCAGNQFCREGRCVASCGGVECNYGESCRDGLCVADPCVGQSCPAGQSCGATGLDAGQACMPDPCYRMSCGSGRTCLAGACTDDPCASVRCPTGQQCTSASGTAQCVTPGQSLPGMRMRAIATGGGAVACAVRAPGERSGSSRGWALACAAGVALAFARRRRSARRVTLALGAAALALGGCHSEPYCYNCVDGAAPRIDAAVPSTDAREAGRVGTDASGFCEAGAAELCDGLDNNCNGEVDEGIDLQTDLRNCGACGVACRPLHAAGVCSMGRCEVAPGGCDVGWYDLNGRPEDGCEYQCTATGTELCDGRDNDCNGRTDEGFDLLTDPVNCGTCNNVCRFDHAVAACVAGMCRMAMCQAGFQDLDNDPATGCEYACSPSGPEVCDGRDNDCNGRTDEGFDLLTNAMNCGACGRACALTGATSACVAGACRVMACLPGHRDLDGNPDNGCEWACGAADGSTSAEVCDGRDNNCDGAVDEGFDLQSDVRNCGTCGTVCGATAMHSDFLCDRGTCRNRGCQAGYYDLDGDGSCEYACTFRSSTELCNGLDDNCNGRVDEGVMAPPPSSVCGVSPGATRPECTTGVTVACSSGAWRCTFPAGVCSGASCAATPELCDALDNNCDGRLNENTPTYGLPCASDDGLPPPGDGVCRTTGTYVCATTSTVRCSATRADCATLPGGCTELCDGLDNDCDGLVDETFQSRGTNAANYVRPAVVRLGASLWAYAFEASRPTATATMPGAGNGYTCNTVAGCADATINPAPAGVTLDRTPACSTQGRLPWFNVHANEAQQSCRAVGGHLCTTAELTQGCQATQPCTFGYAPRGATCTSAYVAGSRFCNLGPSYDFNASLAGDQDGLLVTGSPALQNCWADWSGLQGNTAATSRLYDVTGNLRELTYTAPNNFTLLGGSFLTPAESGATCTYNFYAVDSAYQYFDTGFRCCFSADPTL